MPGLLALRKTRAAPCIWSKLALAELFAATRLVEADFFTFDFAGIAGNQAGLLERRLQCFVVVDQRTGDTVAHRASLAAFAAAVDVDMKIERLEMTCEIQGLTHNHASGFAGKVFVDGLAVDNDFARAFLDRKSTRLNSS